MLYINTSERKLKSSSRLSLEKIYCIAPSFRAEKSQTSRHLTEYWHAEMEMAWSNFDDILKHGENLLKYKQLHAQVNKLRAVTNLN